MLSQEYPLKVFRIEFCKFKQHPQSWRATPNSAVQFSRSGSSLKVTTAGGK